MSPAPFGWAVDALIASALLMAAVLVARGPARRAFGPQVAYALWALPLLRCLLPPLPAAWWRETAPTPVTRAGETLAVLVIEPTRAVASAAPSPLPLGLVLTVLWAGGAAVFFAFHLLKHRGFCRRILAAAERIATIEGVTVLASAAAPGPLAFGVARRFVAFPPDFAERFDADERALALAHELGHHERRDLLANWAALAVLALHWFNPLAWRAFHAFRADQELANDARVLAGRSAMERHAYACAIVKAAHGRAVSAACHLHTITDLKGRLRMLTTSRASRRRLATGSVAVALLVATGLGLTASGSRAAERLKTSLGDALQAAPVAPPAPPAPPTPPEPTAEPAPPVAVAEARAPAHKRRVVVVKDGKATSYEGADADRFIAERDLPAPPVPPSVVIAPGQPGLVVRRFHLGQRDAGPWVIDVPEVSNARCAGDADRPVVENQVKRGKRRIVVCTNRIEVMQRNAERVAANSVAIERSARLSARASLGVARAAIERDRNLTDAQRREALAGIAQAETELQADPHAD